MSTDVASSYTRINTSTDINKRQGAYVLYFFFHMDILSFAFAFYSFTLKEDSYVKREKVNKYI